MRIAPIAGSTASGHHGDRERRARSSAWSSPESPRWLIAAILLKLSLLVFLAWQASAAIGKPFTLYQVGGDTRSYFEPIERLLAHGEYVSERDNRAGRMPGYGFTYLPFRLLFGAEGARSALVLLQALLSGVSAYYLALTAFLVFGRTDVFFATLGLYGLNLFVSVWDVSLMTESLAASAAILYLHALLRYRAVRRTRWLAYASLWFAYLVFLRPMAGPLILSAPLILADVHRASPTFDRWRAVAAGTVLVAGVFIAADAVWILRNYAVLGTFVPLQSDISAGYAFTPAERAIQRWTKVVGEDGTWWQPNTLSSWFYGNEFSNEAYVIPAVVSTTACPHEAIRRARTTFVAARTAVDAPTRSRLDAEVAREIQACAESFKRERPFRYHLVSPLRTAKISTVHTGPIFPGTSFSEMRKHPLGLLIKLSAVVLYWLALVSGLLGLVRALWRRDPVVWAAAWPFVFVGTFCFLYLRTTEARLWVIGFPSLCLLGAAVIAQMARPVLDRLRPAVHHHSRA
jgi:hypothetical protein